ncbi:MAG: ribulose-phosphate 3-epimerase [Acidimicrobiia bacterium]
MKPKLAPSILSADFWALGDAIEAVSEHADMIHVDVMDGCFVPNITMGNVVIEAIKAHSNLFVDCHLMAVRPASHFDSLAASGADSISFHYEASDDPRKDLSSLRKLGIGASIAINPSTSEEVLITLLDSTDMVVVMSVNPGFSGQRFIESAIDKIRCIRQWREEMGLGFEIEVDGGITAENIERAAEAGATVFVSASSIFGSKDPAGAAAELKRLASVGMARCPFGASSPQKAVGADNLLWGKEQ